VKKIREINPRTMRRIKCTLLLVPFIIYIFAFSYIPLFGWSYSFFDYKLGKGLAGSEFVGLKHFMRLLTDKEITRVMRNTLVMSSLSLLTSYLPMFSAVLLNDIRNLKVKKFVQTSTTLPNFISWIIVYGVAFSIFSSNGLLNELLEMLHLPTSKYGLIGNSDAVWFFQLGLGIWKSLGWSTIIYMAAIAGIDTELYDAAKVDGANKLQLVRYITLPGMLPTYFVLVLLAISSFLSTGFEQYYVFWNALVSDKIEVLDYHVYKIGFQTFQYSFSIAIGMLKSIVSICLLFTVNFMSKKLRGSSIV